MKGGIEQNEEWLLPRLLAVSGDRGTFAGDVGTVVAFKRGHFGDHRLFVGKNAFGAD